MVDREENRVGERIIRFLSTPFMYLAPTLITTPIDTLAKSLIASTIFAKQTNDENTVNLIDNKQIFALAELYDAHKND